jgi:Fe-S-cluster-containing dehydrogenase component
MACLSVCPVGAIKEDPEKFDLDKCAAQLRRFSKEEKLNTLICGICVRACAGRGSTSQIEAK